MARIICGCCSAEIDTETGETHFVKGSNAHSIDTLQNEKTQLQYDLEKMKEQYDLLLEKYNNLKEGKPENEPRDDTDDEFRFPWQK